VGIVSMVVLLVGAVGLFALEDQPGVEQEEEGCGMMGQGMMGGGKMGPGMMHGGMMGEGMMGGGMGMMCPMGGRMMRMMGKGAGAEEVLLLADKLGLSPEQRKQLSDLKLQQQLKTIELKAEVEKAEARLEALLAAEEIDLDAARKAVQEVADAGAELQFARIEGTVKAKQVLTPEQREKLRGLKQMHGGRGMMCGGGLETKEEGAPTPRERSGMKRGGRMPQMEEGSGSRAR